MYNSVQCTCLHRRYICKDIKCKSMRVLEGNKIVNNCVIKIKFLKDSNIKQLNGQ